MKNEEQVDKDIELVNEFLELFSWYLYYLTKDCFISFSVGLT